MFYGLHSILNSNISNVAAACEIFVID